MGKSDSEKLRFIFPLKKLVYFLPHVSYVLKLKQVFLTLI